MTVLLLAMGWQIDSVIMNSSWNNEEQTTETVKEAIYKENKKERTF